MTFRVLAFTVFLLIIFTGCKDDCDGVQCANGGVCLNGDCDCPEGFFGSNCELMDDPCSTVECLPDETCNNGTCECTTEFSNSEINFDDGVYVINEGNFLSGNSSLSYYNPDHCTIIKNDLYNKINNDLLGDVFQSMFADENRHIMVINNSGKVVVADQHLRQLGTITGLSSPNYATSAGLNNIYYLTDLFGEYMYRFSTVNYNVIDSVYTGNGTGPLVTIGNKVFITTTLENQLLIYDYTTDELNSLSLEYGMNSIVKTDNDQHLWVLCAGSFYDPGPAKLFQIDVASESVFKTIPISEGFPSDLILDEASGQLYFLNGDVYRMSELAVSEPSIAFIKADNRSLYALGQQPSTKELYVADAIDFSSAGQVYRYQEDGTEIDNFTVGIIPGGFYFHN